MEEEPHVGETGNVTNMADVLPDENARTAENVLEFISLVGKEFGEIEAFLSCVSYNEVFFIRM